MTKKKTAENRSPSANAGPESRAEALNTTLPDAELDVLAALARIEPAPAKALREALEDQRPMAHGSVLTLLKRLEAKGLVSREKGPVGKAFIYRTHRESQRTLRTAVQGLAHRIFAGDRVALVASLFNGPPPDTSDIERLRELLDELEQRCDQENEV